MSALFVFFLGAFSVRASATLTQTITANMEAAAELELSDGGTQSTIPLKVDRLPGGDTLITPAEL
jgi:hypothetical protein